ncbi:hypothetical protein IFM89_021955 [Coptis chinensis]|uniref:RING-type domain-containing protein n=1 Tax=Coptis chinensis TaxID=261450 RepID=A0A835HEV5_9MAGN|nr:hypothetical protein IFM89_021955 [Coptis chinensis]
MNQLKQIHTQMILTGLILDGFSVSRLIAFCAISESGCLAYCKRVLENTDSPNIYSWNLAIRGYSESSKLEQTILLYKIMLRNGETKPDNYTFPFVLKACAQLAFVQLGFEILGHVLKLGFDSNIYIYNAVLHMLVSCGEVELAGNLFDESCLRDLVSWNTVINGYVRSGRGNEALRVFGEMQEANVMPDEVTMIGVVSSCAQIEDLKLGKEFHKFIEENGIRLTIPLSNALMDMYVKCGSLEPAQVLFRKMTRKTMVTWTTMLVGFARCGFLDSARNLFNEMPERDAVSWNALISSYVHAERARDALALFHEMQAMNVKPNEVTMVSLLSACSQLGALDTGEWVHHYIDKHKILLNVTLGTALVDMYAKCGNIAKAVKVFREIPQRNSLTWTSVINGLALHGHAKDSISFFLEMISIGFVPDEVTFIGVLSACCHAGFVDEGRQFFAQMSTEYNISPKMKHYSCMVDLLGRADLLSEAEQLIKTMPMEPDTVILGALFFACKNHGNVAIGERVAAKLLELDPHDGGNYVQLANMYLEANMREKAEKVRMMMWEKGLDKTPGCSSIEVDGAIHEFVVRDKSHPKSQEIYAWVTTTPQDPALPMMETRDKGICIRLEFAYHLSLYGASNNVGPSSPESTSYASHANENDRYVPLTDEESAIWRTYSPVPPGTPDECIPSSSSDDDSSQELTNLTEAVGTQSRGVSKKLISTLPVSKYKTGGGFFARKKTRVEQCVICQTEYINRDSQITLPCKHVYHERCIKMWLEISKACPACCVDVTAKNSCK